MALMILHGDNTVQSRQKLYELTSAAKLANKSVIHLEAKKLEIIDLEQQLGTSGLFDEPKVIVIEELLGLLKSKNKTALIEYVAGSDLSDLDLILWEKKKVTATALKPFAKLKPNIQEFKTSSAVFTWLDNLFVKDKKKRLQLFLKASQQDGAEMCLAMLNRQIRLLLTAKSGGVVKGAPFMIQKLNAQAKSLTLEQLLAIHEQLTFLDYHWKTGRLKLSLEQEIVQRVIQWS